MMVASNTSGKAVWQKFKPRHRPQSGTGSALQIYLCHPERRRSRKAKTPGDDLSRRVQNDLPLPTHLVFAIVSCLLNKRRSSDLSVKSLFDRGPIGRFDQDRC